MTNFSQKNALQIFVGKDVAGTSSPSLTGLADGEVRCFTPGGTVYTEAAADANDEFIIAMGRGTGNEPLVSTKIKKDWVTRISKKDYAADTQQLDYIGSNGTAGSIVVSNNTVYRATINMIESPETTHGGVYVKDMVFESDASATQDEIALGLAKSGIGNFDREHDKPIRFRAVSDHALDTNDTMDETVTVTKGSKKISIATDYDYNTGTQLVVGDFIRIADSDTTVATTDDVYRVEVITSTSDIELDRPYQGTTGTRTHGNNSTQAITIAEAAAANWGVSLTGLDLKWSLGKINDKIAKWDLKLDSDSFGTTTLLNSTSASLGTGTYHQVADLERFAMGNNGEIFRKGEPNIYSYPQMALSTETYDIITIEIEKGRTDSLGYVKSPQTVMIAVPATSAGNDEWYDGGFTDDTTDVLEDLLDGVPAYTTANSFDGTALTGGDLDASS